VWPPKRLGCSFRQGLAPGQPEPRADLEVGAPLRPARQPGTLHAFDAAGGRSVPAA
jgi:hypothetical protein